MSWIFCLHYAVDLGLGGGDTHAQLAASLAYNGRPAFAISNRRPAYLNQSSEYVKLVYSTYIRFLFPLFCS